MASTIYLAVKIFRLLEASQITGHLDCLRYFAVGFKPDYVNADGNISNYIPDFP